MKKTDYLAPEMEMIEVKYNNVLMASGDTAEQGGEGDPDKDLD